MGDGEMGAELRELLVELAGDSTQEVRLVARFALGRVAGRPGVGAGALEGSDEVSNWLLRDLARGRSTDRAGAGLALGIAAASRKQASIPFPREWQRAIEQELADASRPEDRAALALALGLTVDVPPGDMLGEAFERVPEGELRARIAFAMGLAGDRAQAETIQDWMDTREGDRFAVARGIEALALLGSVGVLEDARVELEREPALVRGIGLLEGLGRVGDERVVSTVSARPSPPRPTCSERPPRARSAPWPIGELLPWCQDLADVANVSSRISTLFDFGGGGLLGPDRVLSA